MTSHCRAALAAAGLPATPPRLSDVFARHPRRAYNRKLTDADAAEIRRRAAEGQTMSALSRMYGVARQSVYDIVDGNHYRERPAA